MFRPRAAALAAAAFLLPVPARTRTSPCLLLQQGVSLGTPLSLPDSVGYLRLPPLTTVEPLGHNPHGRHLVLEDSTVVDVWVTPYPAGGLAAKGASSEEEAHCQTTIAGHSAFVSRVTLAFPNRAREYLGVISVMLNDTASVNISVSTATAASRDGALSEVAGRLTLMRAKK